MLSEAILKIENQRKDFKKDSSEDGLCQVLLGLCRENSAFAAAIAKSDKTVKDCYKKMYDFASKNKSDKAYYMGPATTERIIREFYSVAGSATTVTAFTPASVSAAKPSNTVNILDFLD